MTLPRPVLIALLGLALCAAAFLATRSANDTGGAVTSSPPVAAPAPVKKPAAVAKPAVPGHKASAPAHKPATHAAQPAVKAHAPGAQATKPRAAVKPQTPAKPALSPEVAKVLPAIKALARGDVVVFFVTHSGSADDAATRGAVRAVSHQKGVSVFTIGLGELETYRPVLSGAGVSQVPAVVVYRAGHKARLLQGFIDPATLRQTVADARR
jgi:hypothetical protein